MGLALCKLIRTIPLGKALDIFTDLITCSFTHFIPFIYFRENHQDILDKYSDINFVYEKEEKMYSKYHP